MYKLVCLAFMLLWNFSFSGLLCQNTRSDSIMIDMITREGTENSKTEDLAFWLTDYSGHRLTGSRNASRGFDVAGKLLNDFGIENIRLEVENRLHHGGWDNLKAYAAMTAPYYASFCVNPVAWTGSTRGMIRGRVVLVDIASEQDIEKYRGKLKGKIVMIPPDISEIRSREMMKAKSQREFRAEDFEKPDSPVQPSQHEEEITDSLSTILQKKIVEFLRREKAGIILRESFTLYPNVPSAGGSDYSIGDPEPVPELNLPPEAFGRVERLLRHGIEVRMEIKVKNKFTINDRVSNLIGEIPGGDPELKDEIVLIGAHLDSWHGGTGAGDNAAACVVMMETMRILKTIGIQPRRTIRIALWDGEEHGFLGSSGYVQKYLFDPVTKTRKPEYSRFSVYYNMDNASGKFRGIYLHGNTEAQTLFETWLAPFNEKGCSIVSLKSYGNTDHVVFDEINLPAFIFIQEHNEHSRAHHTIADTYERLNITDLQNNAIILAYIVYKSAMNDQKIPRKTPVNTF